MPCNGCDTRRNGDGLGFISAGDAWKLGTGAWDLGSRLFGGGSYSDAVPGWCPQWSIKGVSQGAHPSEAATIEAIRRAPAALFDTWARAYASIHDTAPTRAQALSGVGVRHWAYHSSGGPGCDVTTSRGQPVGEAWAALMSYAPGAGWEPGGGSFPSGTGTAADYPPPSEPTYDPGAPAPGGGWLDQLGEWGREQLRQILGTATAGAAVEAYESLPAETRRQIEAEIIRRRAGQLGGAIGGAGWLPWAALAGVAFLAFRGR